MKNPDEALDNDTSYDTGETNDTFLEHQETTYYAVYDNPHTGVASLGPLGERQLNRGPRRETRLPQTMEASARASRKRLRDHAVYHQLGACVVLTYARFTTDPKSDVEKFVRKARCYYPNKLHYAVVTEGSVEPGGIRLHHNVLLPASPHLADIANIWTHGDVFVGINPSDDCIRRAVNYVTKEFVRAEGLGARFIKSKSKVPKPLKQVFDNRDDAEAALVNKIPEGASGVSEYVPGCGFRKIFYWNVNPDQIEGV
jgi:hypothetical protein